LPWNVVEQYELLADCATLQNYGKEVALRQASFTKEHPFLYPKFVFSAKVSSTVYHPESFNRANVNPEKPFVAPKDVPVINSS